MLENISYLHYNMPNNYNCFQRFVNLSDIILTLTLLIEFHIYLTFQL